jgi:hypothetical protein
LDDVIQGDAILFSDRAQVRLIQFAVIVKVPSDVAHVGAGDEAGRRRIVGQLGRQGVGEGAQLHVPPSEAAVR